MLVVTGISSESHYYIMAFNGKQSGGAENPADHHSAFDHLHSRPWRQPGKGNHLCSWVIASEWSPIGLLS